MDKQPEKKRSIIAITLSIFTWQWILQTLAAWAVSLGLTKLWKKYVKKERTFGKQKQDNNK